MLPAIAGLGVILGMFTDDISGFLVDLDVRSKIADAQKSLEVERQTPSPEMQELAGKEFPPLRPLRLLPPALIWIAVCAAFGFASVFSMRSNGYFALFFRPELDLIADAKEIKYVAKPKVERDEDEEPSSVATVLVFAVMTLLYAVFRGIKDEAPFLYMAIGLAGFVSWAPVAGLWRIFEKAREPGWKVLAPVARELALARIAQKPMWWGLLLLIPLVNIPIWVLMSLEIAKHFRKGTGFGFGLAFLWPVFFCILGLGNDKYRPQ
jgi:hypothetical protein